jgi:hypothetical protein
MTRNNFKTSGGFMTARSPLQYKGVRAIAPPDLTIADRAPISTDTAFQPGQLWLDKANLSSYQYSGTDWISFGTGTTAAINTITGDAGGAKAPSAGNFSLLGTANQITVTGGTNKETFSLSATLLAPGTVTATTTLTATLGAITATNGNFVATAAGTGILLNSAQASGAAASPVVVNGRSGRATFTSVSIAAAADLTLTITNSAITAATTEVMLSMSGATTGAALSIKSKTASAGSLAIVVTNGTGATTSIADIQIDFLVLNA